MILKLIMDMLKALILFVISLFPEFPQTSFVADYIDPVRSLLGKVDAFISVQAVGVCFMAILLCYNARAIWSIVMWVVRKIPGVS